MSKFIHAIVCLLIVASSACNQNEKPNGHRFIEYLAVEGECFEDHVKQPARFTGELVHWYNETTNTHSRYGAVHNWASMEIDKMLEEIKDPYKYRPPFTVTFGSLTPEQFSSDKIKANGISEHLPKDVHTV
jgi:hypothetical protein